ncbi:uncharacterized protein J7T54_006616 [Emericellopsis cladophorae]|uniref:Uncharacterized protein n=1 Tax=Emericellopsis cladophorae TaxID=2686198 RepID=A0A9P9Y6V9_9HYPO|nr:uncharacterized protein J7T54_006616 [Emericellopsis cladophorae]KAI6784571.1 hypothetical protein J7T54_006616 [Emericellopsis cladophorae]
MAITTAVSDFFASIYELVSSVFCAAYSVVHSVFLAAYNFVVGILSLVGDVLGGFVDISTGVGKFIVGNIVILSIGALVAFLYMRNTAQGQKLAQKKTS